MKTNDFDIIIIGGGHAGVEAALVAARLGKSVALMTMEADKLAVMSCNPAVGGVGKSHIVKEIDALGGIMARAADHAGIQFRRLNLSRGPAVWSTRVQCDRRDYNRFVCETVAAEPRIRVIEALAGAFIVENSAVVGVRDETGIEYACGACIVATGTFLGGLIHIGQKSYQSGRLNERAAYRLCESLLSLGFEVGRLKTGTPPRLNGETIDFSTCQVQPGDTPAPLFSAFANSISRPQVPCHLTYTTAETKRIISENLSTSAMFSG
ncbi:MAG: FAD-dependent oxidoreductase, partial [Candidatus Zixiibacteriota bacterium]